MPFIESIKSYKVPVGAMAGDSDGCGSSIDKMIAILC